MIKDDKIQDGFVVYKKNRFNNVITKYKFNVVPITRSYPPTKILLEYDNCEKFYKLTKYYKENTAYFQYKGYNYEPEEPKLLRYSASGIVTMDYIICRITITGENKFKLKIES